MKENDFEEQLFDKNYVHCLKNAKYSQGPSKFFLLGLTGLSALLVMFLANSERRLDVVKGHVLLHNTEGLIGGGYSRDKQQLVAQKCFNGTVASITERQNVVKLYTAQSFSELENQLGVSVSLPGGFWMFSTIAEATYLKSVQDMEYSFSLNYYSKYSEKVSVQIPGKGEQALSESGKSFYENGTNPYFSLVCGDHYITSYEQGALLTMSMNIIFSSFQAKQEFGFKVGYSFGDIVSASLAVQKFVSGSKMTGSVRIQAFQVGGDPQELSKIFNSNKTGQYYALTCSLSAISNCVAAATGLLDYATKNLPTQLENNTGLTALGIGFTNYDPITYIGLSPSVSLVTPQVEQYRLKLSNKFQENQYYEQKLHPFVSRGYPVDLDEGFLINASSILSKVNSNIFALQRKHGGGADCFNFPDQCENVTAGLQLQNITNDDLKFLENIKYTFKMTADSGVDRFYSTGKNSSWQDCFTEWFNLRKNWKGPSFFNITETDTQLSFYSLFNNTNTQCFYDGYSTNRGLVYAGELNYRSSSSEDWKILFVNFSLAKEISQFFFEAFNSTAIQ